MTAAFFAESASETRFSWTDGAPSLLVSRRTGAGTTVHLPQRTTYRWLDAVGAERASLDLLPAEVAGFLYRHRELEGAVPTAEREGLAALAESLDSAARAHGALRLAVSLLDLDRQVLHLGPEGLRGESTRRVALELRPYVRGRALAHVVRFSHYADLQALLAARDLLLGGVERMVRDAADKADPAPAPEGLLTVVIAPGSGAGAFFHEVCGHPMEADVMLRGVSYLSGRQGTRVAPAFVSVVDDPTEGHYTLDDEGHPAERAWLVRDGILDQPLLDGAAARHAGCASNGHGRRVSFRHVALPRMSHTAVLPHEGTLDGIVGEVERGLLLDEITPRHVSIASGDFTFWLDEARLIEDGVVTRYVDPSVLRGNGLDALRNIDAVGAHAAALHGVKGCRKLDHGPLPVSFGLPAVRIRGLAVERVVPVSTLPPDARDLAPDEALAWAEAACAALSAEVEQAQVAVFGEFRVDVEVDPTAAATKVGLGQHLRATVRLWRDGQAAWVQGPIGDASSLRLLVERARSASWGPSSGHPAAAAVDLGPAPPALDLERIEGAALDLARALGERGIRAQTVLGAEVRAFTVIATRDGPSRSEWHPQTSLWARCETRHGPVVDGLSSAALDALPADAFAERLARAVEPLLDGRPPLDADRALPLVIRPHVAAQLVAALGRILSGDVMAKVPIGRAFAPPAVTLIDDPASPEGPRRSFDDEGTPTGPLVLLREGRLEQVLHSVATAARLGGTPNGRGFVGPAGGLPSPGALHLAVLPGADAPPEDHLELTTRVEVFSAQRHFGRLNLVVAGWAVRSGARVRSVGPFDLDVGVLHAMQQVHGVGPDPVWCASAGAASPTLRAASLDALCRRG